LQALFHQYGVDVFVVYLAKRKLIVDRREQFNDFKYVNSETIDNSKTVKH